MEQMTLEKFKRIKKDDLYKIYLDLNNQVQELINENEKLKVQKIKNERNAGRKQKFTSKQIQEIKQLREENKSIREIAKQFECSVGLVHKIVSK